MSLGRTYKKLKKFIKLQLGGGKICVENFIPPVNGASLVLSGVFIAVYPALWVGVLAFLGVDLSSN